MVWSFSKIMYYIYCRVSLISGDLAWVLCVYLLWPWQLRGTQDSFFAMSFSEGFSDVSSQLDFRFCMFDRNAGERMCPSWGILSGSTWHCLVSFLVMIWFYKCRYWEWFAYQRDSLKTELLNIWLHCRPPAPSGEVQGEFKLVFLSFECAQGLPRELVKNTHSQLRCRDFDSASEDGAWFVMNLPLCCEKQAWACEVPIVECSFSAAWWPVLI